MIPYSFNGSLTVLTKQNLQRLFTHLVLKSSKTKNMLLVWLGLNKCNGKKEVGGDTMCVNLGLSKAKFQRN